MTPRAIAIDEGGFVYKVFASGSGASIQVELGSKATSYIPTTTAAATRAADSATFAVPTGINQLVYTFDDNSTQVVAVSPGSYTIPTNLNRANIKSIAARYAFDFTGGSLPAGMTFSRPSIGTYFNSGGTLITAGNDVARMNYVGGVSCLLIEGSATNMILNSNNFAAASWFLNASSVITPSQFVSPDGTNNGWSLTSGDGSGFAGVNQTGTSFTAGIKYVSSCWSKFIVGTSPMSADADSGPQYDFPTTATLTRFSVISDVLTGLGGCLFSLHGPVSKTDGIYGAQVETGLVMTSYIPTTGTAVTRAADNATFTVPAGIGQLLYTFDDNTTQSVTVSAGSYTIPVTLNRSNIKSIVGSA